MPWQLVATRNFSLSVGSRIARVKKGDEVTVHIDDDPDSESELSFFKHQSTTFQTTAFLLAIRKGWLKATQEPPEPPPPPAPLRFDRNPLDE